MANGKKPSRKQLIDEVTKRASENFKNKQHLLKKFLGNQFEKYKSASEERKNEILQCEITACAQEIVPNYNRILYALFARYMSLPFIALRNLTSNIVIEEKTPGAIKKLKKITRESCICYISNHLSNLDELVEGYFIYKYNLPTPIFLAGKNLFKGLSKLILPLFNASCLDRERIESKDILRWKLHAEFIKAWAKHKEDILCFITSGRPYDGDQRKKKNISSIFIKALSEAVKQGHPVYIEPLSISYTRVPEDKKLYAHALAGDSKGARVSDLFSGWLKTNLAFRKNPVYLTVHEPLPLEDTKSYKEIADNLADEIYGAVKIPTEKLLAAAVSHMYRCGDFETEGNILYLDSPKVIEIVREIKNHLIAHGANLEQMVNEATAAKIAEYGAEKYKRRRALKRHDISSLSIPRKEIYVFIVNANHIKHKLPEHMQETISC